MTKLTKLTKKQIKAIFLCSGEFGNMTSTEAAKQMGISEQAVNRLLNRAEQVCPQIFPLLTKQEADTIALLKLGWSNHDIATQFEVSVSRVSQIVGALHGKSRGIADSSPVKMLAYAPHMDDKIREKF